MPHKPQQYFVALAVIFNDKGEVLLTKRNAPGNKEVHGKWQFPGGSINQNEHPEQTALREIKEEIGLTIEILSPRPYIFSYVFNNGTHAVLTVYKTTYVSGTIDISLDLKETSDAQWFDPQSIAILPSMPMTTEILQIVLKDN